MTDLATSGGLSGRLVLITRAAHQSEALRANIEARAGQVLELPTIRVVPVEDRSALHAAIGRAGRYDAVAFGSSNSVDILLEEAERLAARFGCPAACVGRRTAHHLQNHRSFGAVFGGRVVASSVARAEGLVELLRSVLGSLEGKRILWPRAAEARDFLVGALTEAGACVDAPVLYRLLPSEPASAEALRLLETVDAVLFLSGETLRCFFEVVPERDARALLDRAVVGVLGPVACDAAQRLGVRVDVVPSEATMDALLDAVADDLARSSRGVHRSSSR